MLMSIHMHTVIIVPHVGIGPLTMISYLNK